MRLNPNSIIKQIPRIINKMQESSNPGHQKFIRVQSTDSTWLSNCQKLERTFYSFPNGVI